jgi:hypothetical protein
MNNDTANEAGASANDGQVRVWPQYVITVPAILLCITVYPNPIWDIQIEALRLKGVKDFNTNLLFNVVNGIAFFSMDSEQYANELYSVILHDCSELGVSLLRDHSNTTMVPDEEIADIFAENLREYIRMTVVHK